MKIQDFYFPFEIICTNFNEDDELFEVNCLDIETDYIYNNEQLSDFILVENLQDLYEETTKLMAKGFIDKMLNTDVISRISHLTNKAKVNLKENKLEFEKSEYCGFNEYLNGKVEGYEECLKILLESSNIE